MVDNHCWGCGADNEEGLKLKSEWQGDAAVAQWLPSPAHAAGPRHFLNGGVMATLLDCHGVCTAVADAYRRAGRPIGSAPEIWHATTSLEIRYLRPTPIDVPVVLRATVVSADEEGTTVECVLEAAEKERARARVISVRVPDSWRHAATR